jgi:TatD DNase family protein
MACSSSAAGPALRHDARGIRRVRKIRRVSASSADVATAAPPVTLPYVDTHCHLDLIFEKMNARVVSAKKKDESGMPPPGAVHHASWLRAVRELESDWVLTSRKTSEMAAETVSPRMEACLTVACSAKAQARVRALLIECESPPEGVFAAFGCHPLSASDWFASGDAGGDSVAAATRRLVATHPRVVAVGECGLDYYFQPSGHVINGSGEKDAKRRASAGEKTATATETEDGNADEKNALDPEERARRETQAKTFIAQMALASELGAPIVVHTREAEEDTLRLMREHLPRDHRIHVHCFTSSAWLARELLAHFPNLCLGFTGVVTFKNAPEVREVVAETPLDRILLETDGPYMAPAPRRGEVAHPGHVPYIAAKIAEIKGVSIEEVFVAAREATRRVYGI